MLGITSSNFKFRLSNNQSRFFGRKIIEYGTFGRILIFFLSSENQGPQIQGPRNLYRTRFCQFLRGGIERSRFKTGRMCTPDNANQWKIQQHESNTGYIVF